MGMSASQARLLTLTSRLSDLELQAQQISNAKIRLSQKSEDAATNYNNALTKETLQVYAGVDTDTQDGEYISATASNLTTYGAISTTDPQRFLENSSGQVLISNSVASIYEANKNDLNGFLKAMGCSDDELTAVATKQLKTLATSIEGSSAYTTAITGSTSLDATQLSSSLSSLSAKLTEIENMVGSSSTTGQNIQKVLQLLNLDAGYVSDGEGSIDQDILKLAMKGEALPAEDDWALDSISNEGSKEDYLTKSFVIRTDLTGTCLNSSTMSSSGTTTADGKTLQLYTAAEIQAHYATSEAFLNALGYTSDESKATSALKYDASMVAYLQNCYSGLQAYLINTSSTYSENSYPGNGNYSNYVNDKNGAVATWNNLPSTRASEFETTTTADGTTTTGINITSILSELSSTYGSIDTSKSKNYTNLFNMIKENGYFTATDDEMNSSDWLYAKLNSGSLNLVEQSTTEDLDGDGEKDWKEVSWSSGDSTLKQDTDDEAIARAETKYDVEMAEIQTKDKIFDLQLKNVDTEHNAVQTEFDTVKKVIEKNVERSMKLFNA